MKNFLIRIWHYMPMFVILMMSLGTYISVQSYLNKPLLNNNYKIIHEPLYDMKNAVFHDMSQAQNKKTYYTINAQNAVQYEDDETFALKKINIYSYQNKLNQTQDLNCIKNTDCAKQISTIVADSGIIDQELSSIEFSQAQIKGYNSQNKFDIISNHIFFYPDLDMIQTKSRTNIKHTTNLGKINTLDADSVIFDNTEQSLKLQGKVKGMFSPK